MTSSASKGPVLGELRPGLRYSDKPSMVHAGREVRAALGLADMGIALCEAPVMLFGRFPGPGSDPFTGPDNYCPVCVARYRELLGEQAPRKTKKGQFVMQL